MGSEYNTIRLSFRIPRTSSLRLRPIHLILTSPRRRNHLTPPQGRYTKGTSTRCPGRFLLLVLCCNKERRRTQTHFRPEGLKHLPPPATLLYGNPRVHYPSATSRRLVHCSGSSRCLFSRFHSSTLQKIPPFLLRRFCFSILHPPLWSLHGSAHFHKVHGTGGCLPSSERYSRVPLYRRLAYRLHLSTGCSTKYRVCPAHTSAPGIAGQHEEISSNSYSSNKLHRGTARFHQGESLSHAGTHHKVHKAVHTFQHHRTVSAWKAQHLLGLMAPTTTALPHARLKMHSLQAWFLALFDPMRDSARKCLPVTTDLVKQLEW